MMAGTEARPTDGFVSGETGNGIETRRRDGGRLYKKYKKSPGRHGARGFFLVL